MRLTTLALVLSAALVGLLPASARSQIPDVQTLVGTPDVCPSLNAHNRTACRFRRGRHDFQVWPSRIAIEHLDGPAWLLTSSGNKDGMFDHTIGGGVKDDHMTFRCVLSGDGRYYGPIDFNVTHGGIWATFGPPVVMSVVEIAKLLTANPAISVGGDAAIKLGQALSTRYGDRSWEKQAGMIAQDICAKLASRDGMR